jgi:hypothetical protein
VSDDPDAFQLRTESDWRGWIRSRIREANPLLWVRPGALACSPRPLRYDHRYGGRIPLIPAEARSTLLSWLCAVKNQGVGTIVCLATLGELRRYSAINAPHPDLLAFYRAHGFLVHHHPVEDPAHAAPEARVGILDQLERLKPVVLGEYKERTGAMLVHCSGGMDRSTPVVAYIAEKADADG